MRWDRGGVVRDSRERPPQPRTERPAAPHPAPRTPRGGAAGGERRLRGPTARRSARPPHSRRPRPAPQIFTRLGKCYTFNSGQPGTELLTTLQGGAGNGLELMLNIQQEEYLPVWGDTGEAAAPRGGERDAPPRAAPDPRCLQTRRRTRRG